MGKYEMLVRWLWNRFNRQNWLSIIFYRNRFLRFRIIKEKISR